MRNSHRCRISVYDMDGISGIRIPGAITRDVAKAVGKPDHFRIQSWHP